MTKILLVEDDKSLREIYGVRLLAEGYDIVSAGDGEEALAMAIKEKPQLIVSDVMMPKISGFDMLDILRSTTETKGIKVIMMTALSSEDQRQRGEQLGADRYLVKSQVGIEDVVRTVHEVLGDLPGVGTDPVPTPATAPMVNTSVPTPAPQPAMPTAPAAQQQATPVTPQPQQSAPAPAPFTPSPQPVQQPQSQPIQDVTTSPAAPTTPAPITPSQPTPPQAPPVELPQPTAPFSTTRPANLGERIIQPIDRPATEASGIADRLAQELDTSSATPPLPPAPQSFAPQPAASDGLSFEETPRESPSNPQAQ